MQTRKRQKTEVAAVDIVWRRSSNLTNGWMSTAEPFIVDGIVAALKNHPARRYCWNRTGPSLRLLNKHWRHEMNRHVHSVDVRNPSPDAPAERLLTFPNLTSLAISNYIDLRNLALWIRTVHKIPKLNRLTLTLEHLRSIPRDDLEGLVCQTVEVRQECTPGSLAQLLKLAVIEMEHLIISWTGVEGWISTFLAAAPSVKRLTVNAFSARCRFKLKGGIKSEHDFEAMAALDELELAYRGSNPQALSALNSLVVLKLTSLIHTFEPFRSLTRLKCLHVNVHNASLFDRAFYEVVGRLERLTLHGPYDNVPYLVLPEAFFESAAGLESLSLDFVVIDADGNAWSNLRKLSHLDMRVCELRSEMIPWSRLTSLTSLVMMPVLGINGTPFAECMDFSLLENLRNLDMRCEMNLFAFLETLRSIMPLTNLEHLSLPYIETTMHLESVMNAVEMLRQLPHLMNTDILLTKSRLHFARSALR